jgi:putative salt-induced outer membrane protein YdiY
MDRLRIPTTPAPHRARSGALSSFAAVTLALACAPSTAQALSPFQFEKPGDADKPVWSGSVQAGVSVTSGNARSRGISGEASLARKARRHRLLGRANVALARSRVVVAHDEDGEPGIGPGELREEDRTTREAWGVLGRYDLFVTERSSAYLSATASGDRPAGKQLVLAAQVGYGADVLRSEKHTLRFEIGYDLAREDLVSARALEIHSARVFAGHEAKLHQRLTMTGRAEVLTNLNEERSRAPRIARFEDTRVLASAGVSYKLNGVLSVGLRFSATYDAAPAPRPPPPGASYEPGFAPLADRLDTSTDLVLIGTF